MSGISSGVIKTGCEAIAYREALEKQKQKEDLSDTLKNLNMSSLLLKEDESNGIVDSLAYTLTQLLYHVKIPLSVSFLNISFAGWGKKGAITKEFLKDNQDKFSLVVIGSDLKLQLRDKDINILPTKSGDGLQLLQLIEKDLNKLLLLRNQFKVQKITEVVYEEFISKFSSNKYKMNISFIVRNSHSLKIYTKCRKTFIRFRNDEDCDVDLNENEIWEILIGKDIEYFLVKCLEKLLHNFFKPINQGSLQSCFNFGLIVIDKTFLSRHRDLFEGEGVRGILLKGNVDADEREAVSSSTSTVDMACNVSLKEQITMSHPNGQPDKIGQPSTTQNLLAAVETAVVEKRSVVLVGESSGEPFIADISKLDENARLKILLSIRDAIDKQITGRK